MKISKKIKRKKSCDKPNYPNCDKMSEESLAGLIDSLIFVLGKEAKKRNIELREEAKRQNLEEDLVDYIDQVIKEYEEEKIKDVPKEEKSIIEVLSPSSEDKTDEMTGLTNDDESDAGGEQEDIMENKKEGKLNKVPVDKVSSIQEESPPVTNSFSS